MNFLNNGAGYDLFAEEARKKFYVDKSMLIDAVYSHAMETRKYICITRPRRFGKSTAANMVAAFFDPKTAEESRKLFEGLEIGTLKEKDDNCWAEQGKRNVIRINMIDILEPGINSYQDFNQDLSDSILKDLQRTYPTAGINGKMSIPKA